MPCKLYILSRATWYHMIGIGEISAIMAAVFWSIAAVLYKIGLRDVNLPRGNGTYNSSNGLHIYTEYIAPQL